MAQRLGFSKLVDRMEAGDVLIVTKLDRLGRDALDVSATVKQLGSKVCESTAWRWERST